MGYDTDVARALRPPSKAPWMLVGLLLAGGAGAGYHFYDQLHRAKDETRAEYREGGGRRRRRRRSRPSRRSWRRRSRSWRREKTELATAKEELSKDVQAKTGELEQLKGTYDKLEDKMKDEIAKGDIRLSQSGGKLRVDLVDKILFDSGEAVISKRGEGVLSRVGAVLAAMDDKQIQVSGHTDSNPISEKLAPQFPTNWELSVARAVNVVRFLEEKASVPAKNLIATGYGQYHPIASNKTAAGRARNRRIEILLTPSLDPEGDREVEAHRRGREAQAVGPGHQGQDEAKEVAPARRHGSRDGARGLSKPPKHLGLIEGFPIPGHARHGELRSEGLPREILINTVPPPDSCRAATRTGEGSCRGLHANPRHVQPARKR